MSDEPEDTPVAPEVDERSRIPDYMPVKNVVFKLVGGGGTLKWDIGAIFKNGDCVKNYDNGSTTIVPYHGYSCVTYTMFDPAAEGNADTSD